MENPDVPSFVPSSSLASKLTPTVNGLTKPAKKKEDDKNSPTLILNSLTIVAAVATGFGKLVHPRPQIRSPTIVAYAVALEKVVGEARMPGTVMKSS